MCKLARHSAVLLLGLCGLAGCDYFSEDYLAGASAVFVGEAWALDPKPIDKYTPERNLLSPEYKGLMQSILGEGGPCEAERIALNRYQIEVRVQDEARLRVLYQQRQAYKGNDAELEDQRAEQILRLRRASKEGLLQVRTPLELCVAEQIQRRGLSIVYKR